MPFNKHATDHNDQKDTEEVDNSLRGRAMRRALQKKLPTTLTPYEWEQWYAEHGIPAAHRAAPSRPKKRWWSSCKWFGPAG